MSRKAPRAIVLNGLLAWLEILTGETYDMGPAFAGTNLTTSTWNTASGCSKYAKDLSQGNELVSWGRGNEGVGDSQL